MSRTRGGLWCENVKGKRPLSIMIPMHSARTTAPEIPATMMLVWLCDVLMLKVLGIRRASVGNECGLYSDLCGW
jgi:hypothetical protein